MKPMRSQDRHHVLFSRQIWETYEQGASLRGTPALIPSMDREIHTELHKNIPIVPLVGFHALFSVRKEFQTSNDTFKDIARIQSLIEVSNKHPKAHEIEKGMANLAIHALDLQVPYIRAGIKV